MHVCVQPCMLGGDVGGGRVGKSKLKIRKLGFELLGGGGVDITTSS